MIRPGAMVALILLTGVARAQPPLSGVYDGMLISARGGEVTGAYSTSIRGNGSDAAPQFSCAFLLRGRLMGGRADVTTWTPGDPNTVAGRLVLTPKAAALRLEQEQDGCAMSGADMVRSDFTLDREQDGTAWIAVRMVQAKRAVLHATPGADERRTPYLVAYDPVAVLAARPGWLQVRFYGGAKPVTGWLRRSELVPAAWPAAKHVAQ